MPMIEGVYRTTPRTLNDGESSVINLDSKGNVKTTTTTVLDNSSNTFVSSQQNVTTSGTPVQLPSQAVSGNSTVIIKAKSANTGTITIGDTSAHALNTGAAHFKLAANESLELRVSNLNQIWIDSTVSGEGIEILVG